MMHSRCKATRVRAKKGKRQPSSVVALWADYPPAEEDQIATIRTRTIMGMPKLPARDVALVSRFAANAEVGCNPPWQDLWRSVEQAATAHAKASKITPADAATLVSSLAKARHASSPALLDLLAAPLGASRSLKLSPGDSTAICWGYAMLAHPAPKVFHAVGAAAASQLDKFNPGQVSTLMWSHAVLDVPNPSLFASKSFADFLWTADWTDAADLCKLHQWALWCEERELSALPAPLARRAREAFSTTATAPSALQASVGAALEQLGLSPLHEVRLEAGYSLDLAFEYGGVEVGVEVDGPSHFLGGDAATTPTGAALLKRRQLRHLGERVLYVPYWEWENALDGKSYLLESLRELISPQIRAYATLGLDPTRAQEYSLADVKESYRRELRLSHPDANPGDAEAEARTKELNEAYRCLFSLAEESVARRQGAAETRAAEREVGRWDRVRRMELQRTEQLNEAEQEKQREAEHAEARRKARREEEERRREAEAAERRNAEEAAVARRQAVSKAAADAAAKEAAAIAAKEAEVLQADTSFRGFFRARQAGPAEARQYLELANKKIDAENRQVQRNAEAAAQRWNAYRVEEDYDVFHLSKERRADFKELSDWEFRLVTAKRALTVWLFHRSVNRWLDERDLYEAPKIDYIGFIHREGKNSKGEGKAPKVCQALARSLPCAY